MKQKTLFCIFIVLLSILLSSCSGLGINFYTPGEQRVVQHGLTIDEGLGYADVVFIPANYEDIMDSEPAKDEAYVYVATIIYDDNRQGNYANVVTPGIDTEQDIKKSNFEIVSIKYYKVHLENRSNESAGNKADLKVLALKIIKEWCRWDTNTPCFMP